MVVVVGWVSVEVSKQRGPLRGGPYAHDNNNHHHGGVIKMHPSI